MSEVFSDEQIEEIFEQLTNSEDVTANIPAHALFSTCATLQVGLRNLPTQSPTYQIALKSFNDMVEALEKRAPGCREIFNQGWQPDYDTKRKF